MSFLSRVLLSLVAGSAIALATPALATTYTWTGSAGTLWSNANNWNPPGVPASLDWLVFPAGTNVVLVNDLLPGTTFSSLKFDADSFAINGNTLSALSIEGNRYATFGSPLAVPSGGTQVAMSALIAEGGISGTATLTLTGSLTLSGSHSFSGTFNGTGTIKLQDASYPQATVTGGLSLAGKGSIWRLDAPSTLIPGTSLNGNYGTITVGAGATISTYAASFHGPTPGGIQGPIPGGHDRLAVTGTVTLANGGALRLEVPPNFVATQGQVFKIVDNDAADAIVGTFSGLPEGSVITRNFADYALSYVGGDGNDITLTCIRAPRVWSGAVNGLWSNAGNWTGGSPQPGDALAFPAGVASKAMTNDLPPGTSFAGFIFAESGFSIAGNSIVLTQSVYGDYDVTISTLVDIQGNALTIADTRLLLGGGLSGSGSIFHTNIVLLAGGGNFSGSFVGYGDLSLLDASYPLANVWRSQVLVGSGTIGTLGAGVRILMPTSTSGNYGGRIAASSVTLAGEYYPSFHGFTPQDISYDQLVVSGTVTINPGTLLSFDELPYDLHPPRGYEFRIIDNVGTSPIFGTFDGRPEGSVLYLGNAKPFRLSYVGGDGNDVTLTRLVLKPAGDFNGDTRSDIFWRDAANGLNYLFQMNGFDVSGQGYMPSVPSNWTPVALGDVGGYGPVEILWRESGGLNYLWSMVGTNIVSQGYLPAVPPAWIVAGMGVLNGGGASDVIWRNPSTGENYAWIMSGTAVALQGFLPSVVGVDWEMAGIADYNGDGRADIFWRNRVTGENYLWVMNQLTITSQGFLPAVPAGWELVGSPNADGNLTADVLWRNATTGDNYLWLMDGFTVTRQGYMLAVSDTNWKVVGFGDYDGDGRDDVLWRNATSGQNYLWTLNGLAVATQGFLPSVTGTNWNPVK